MTTDYSRQPQTPQTSPAIDIQTAVAVPRWRENPERLAWGVILASFSVFAALMIAVPFAVNYVIRYSTVSQPSLLEPTLGTLLLYPSESAEPIAVTSPRDDVAAGSRIIAADESTQGSLGLIGDEERGEILGSIQIYPSTDLDIISVRRPFFAASTEPQVARLRLNRGQARIFTNTGSDQRVLHIDLETPHGLIGLDAGSYKVSVDDTRTEMTVRAGSATLQRDGEIVQPVAGERAWMTADAVSGAPVPAEQNLIRNGDFSQPMLDTWNSYVVAEGVTPGEVRIIERDGRRVAHFIRQGEENVPTEVGITQEVNKDVNVYDSLTMQLDVRLMHQSLPGAGYLSSEFPLRVEIAYTDIYGKELRWGHGFYFRDPEDPNWRVTNGEKVPPFNWYTYQSPNLMELLADTRPARIDSIRVYASGWNYQSMVSEIYLSAE